MTLSTTERKAVSAVRPDPWRELQALMAEHPAAQEVFGRFFAAADHKISQPLATLRCGLELSQMRTSDPQLQEVLEQAIRETDRAAIVLRQFTALLTPGKCALPEPMDLTPILQEGIEEWVQAAQVRGRYLRMESVPESKLMVHADGTRLLETLSPMLEHALAATPKGGTVRLLLERGRSTARLVFLDPSQPVAEDLDSMFDPFSSYRPATAARAISNLPLAVASCRAAEWCGTLQSDVSGNGGRRLILCLRKSPQPECDT